MAVIAEISGPAEVKVGQGARVHPNVRPDIAAGLDRLTYRANMPDRVELVSAIEPLLADIGKAYTAALHAKGELKAGETITVRRIGKSLGAASMATTTSLEMSNGKNIVISMQRPFLIEKAQSGFEMMGRFADRIAEKDPSSAGTMRELVQGAKNRLPYEADVGHVSRQYQIGRQLYAGVRVSDGVNETRFNVVEVLGVGNSWFLMSEAAGKHFAELPGLKANSTPAEKEEVRRNALAILTLEFSNILKGQFDPDRHGGQMKIAGNTITHFDLREINPGTWSERGTEQLSEVLFNTLIQSQSNTNVLQSFAASMSAIRGRGETLDPLVLDVQKGFIALGQYARYLEPSDVKRAVFSAMIQGMNPALEQALTSRVIEHIRSTNSPAGKLPDFALRTAIARYFRQGKLPVAIDGIPTIDEITPIKIDRN